MAMSMTLGLSKPSKLPKRKFDSTIIILVFLISIKIFYFGKWTHGLKFERGNIFPKKEI